MTLESSVSGSSRKGFLFRPFPGGSKALLALLFGSLVVSYILATASSEVERRFIEAGGDTNAHLYNFQKIQYIRSHQTYQDKTNAVNHIDGASLR